MKTKILYVILLTVIIMTSCASPGQPGPAQTGDLENTEEREPAETSDLSDGDEGDIGDDYTIRIGSSSDDETDPYKVYFILIYVSDMENEKKLEKRDKINETLIYAATSWFTVDEKMQYSEKNLPDILCHTDRYLSLKNKYGFKGGRWSYVEDFITVDLQTGERVMLNDLVEINDVFVDLLRNGDIIIAGGFMGVDDPDHGTENLRKIFREKTFDEVLNILEQCSCNNLYYATNYSEEYAGDISYFNRHNFYVRPGKLVISYMMDEIIINLDDIEDFLKVPKW